MQNINLLFMKLKILLFIFTFFISVNQVGAYYNMDKVIGNWIKWTNEERRKHDTWDIKINAELTKTAFERANYSKSKWSISHKRAGQKSFYDYNRITSWFSSRGLVFPKVWGSAFSESIWWNTYSCNEKDCTEELSEAVHKTFATYLKEKWKKYSPHYWAMINKNFTQIWVWIVVDEVKHKYYFVAHYATRVVKK